MLALMVDNIKVGAKFFRTVYFFPIVISATALGLLFNLIFLYDGGMLNQLLQNLGLAARISTGRTRPLFRHDDGTCYLAVCGVLFCYSRHRAEQYLYRYL